MSDPQTITFEQLEAAQKLVDGAGLSAPWFVTAVNGSEQDVIARYRAERILSGGRKFEVIHDQPRVLVQLCKDADARFDTAPQAVSVSSGLQDTHTQEV
jgi:hypothetical protein